MSVMEIFADTGRHAPTWSQSRKWCKFVMMSVFGRFCNVFYFALAAIVLVVYGGNLWGAPSLTGGGAGVVTRGHSHSKYDSCVWKEGDPQLFHLKTSSGVHYDGGHWFHVAENFMTQHTLMRQRQERQGIGLTTSSDVYLSLDREAFLEESNSMTRFMLGLGLTNGLFKYLHFVYAPVLDLSHSSAKPGDSFFLPSKSVVSHQVLHMDEPLELRFEKLRSPQNNQGASKTGQCVQFMGSVGGEWPTLQRGHWFSQVGDVETFRSKMSTLCTLSSSPTHTRSITSTPLLVNASEKIGGGHVASSKTKPFKLSVYQRDLSRVIANLHTEALPFLQQHLPRFSEDWEVDLITHDGRRSPCSLMARLRDSDVLLTAHGFQSMLLLFLPRPSLLFEVYPYKYFKQAYSPLAREYGVMHGNVMSPPFSPWNAVLLHGVTTKTCMEYKYCRVFSRGDNVMLTTHGSNQLIGAIAAYQQDLSNRKSAYIANSLTQNNPNGGRAKGGHKEY